MCKRNTTRHFLGENGCTFNQNRLRSSGVAWEQVQLQTALLLLNNGLPAFLLGGKNGVVISVGATWLLAAAWFPCQLVVRVRQ